mmetsp:Transcript_10365/g.23064  ORF Transcript_10365/g.23064 Transcript_10365/m.23064 type:complete len:106 (-) Transcript_10365:712-1029(-)
MRGMDRRKSRVEHVLGPREISTEILQKDTNGQTDPPTSTKKDGVAHEDEEREFLLAIYVHSVSSERWLHHIVRRCNGSLSLHRELKQILLFHAKNASIKLHHAES